MSLVCSLFVGKEQGISHLDQREDDVERIGRKGIGGEEGQEQEAGKGGRSEATMTGHKEKIEVEGTRRYQVIRRLGGGGMGSVYEVADRKYKSRWALKTLLYTDGESLLRFKEEFRGCRHLHHPHLVRLGELCKEEGVWFFTMELLEGVDLITYARQGQDAIETKQDSKRLPLPRAPLPKGIAAGSLAPQTLWEPQTKKIELNTTQAGAVVPYEKVIRDREVFTLHEPQGQDTTQISEPVPFDEQALRQSLAQLVEGLMALHQAGRVHRDIKPSNVMVTRQGGVKILDYGISKDPSNEESSTYVVGTPLYMAPEQVEGGYVGPAADWYAVGVMLYEALVGQAPFAGQGDGWSVAGCKGKQLPLAPGELVVGVPQELNDLCMSLLAIDPKRRPRGEQILVRLIGRKGRPWLQIDRREQEEGYRRIAVQHRIAIGKQLHRIVHEVKVGKKSRVMYLRGEAGSCKSSLLKHLMGRIQQEHPGALIVTGHCYEDEHIPYGVADQVVDQVSRYLLQLPHLSSLLLPRYTYLLRECFPLLAMVEGAEEFWPVPVGEGRQHRRKKINEGLWELLARVGDRTFLVIGVDDLQWMDQESLSFWQGLVQGRRDAPVLLLATVRERSRETAEHAGTVVVQRRQVDVFLEGLASSKREELAQVLGQLAEQHGQQDGQQQRQPWDLLVDLLGSMRGGEEEPAAEWAEQLRRVLQVLCLAQEALDPSVMAQVCQQHEQEVREQIRMLRSAWLVRTPLGEKGRGRVEPYHEQLRQRVCQQLDEQSKRLYHARLAQVAEQTEQGEASVLAWHWQAAGQQDKAASCWGMAAQHAAEQGLWEQAVEGYERALGGQLKKRDWRQRMAKGLGQALQKSGKLERAARVYEQLAKRSRKQKRLQMRLQAAACWLQAGWIDEGWRAVREVSKAVGMQVPTGELEAFERWRHQQQERSQRGRGFESKPREEMDAKNELQLQSSRLASVGLMGVHGVWSSYFHGEHMEMAMQRGVEQEVAWGWAGQGGREGMQGSLAGQGGWRAAQRLAQGKGQDELQVFVWVVGCVRAMQRGQWQTVYERSKEAEGGMSRLGGRWVWAEGMVRGMRARALCYLGRMRELEQEISRQLERSRPQRAMQDTGWPNLVWLARGEGEHARRRRQEAMEGWAQAMKTEQHLGDLIARVHIELYEGKGRKGYGYLQKEQREIERAQLVRERVARVEYLDLQVRGAMKYAIDKAERAVRRLEQEPVEWAAGLAQMGKAGIAYLGGRKQESCSRLLAAEASFESMDMRLHAAVAQWCRGKIAAGGGELIARAQQYFNKEGIVHGAAMVRVLAPWFAEQER